MKMTVLIASLLLTGCAYNSVTITAAGDVYCSSSVDKPVNIRALDENTIPISP